MFNKIKKYQDELITLRSKNDKYEVFVETELNNLARKYNFNIGGLFIECDKIILVLEPKEKLLNMQQINDFIKDTEFPTENVNLGMVIRKDGYTGPSLNLELITR